VKINKDKTQAVYFSHQRRQVQAYLTLKGRHIHFVNNVKYLGVIFITNYIQNRGPFAKFVDSLYYFQSELCGDAVTVSFSMYLPWQAIYFLQRSTHFSKTCCRPLITSKFIASELPFHGWKSLEIAWSEIWTV
jgi:hypothetical protein